MERKNQAINASTRTSLINLVEIKKITIKEAASMLNIKYSTAHNIIKIYKDTDRSVAKIEKGKKKTKNTTEIQDIVENAISINPLLTLKELRQKVSDVKNENFEISMSTINRCLFDLKITVKKIHLELDRVNDLD